MAAFGPPPESNVLSYPGISGNRFDPMSAMKVWAEVIKGEKESGYVHRMLESKGKLGLPDEWAHDLSRRDGILPNYESLDEVYYMTGWKKDKFGRSEQPDIRHLIPALRRSDKEGFMKKKKHQRFDDGLTWEPYSAQIDLYRPASALSESRSHRSSATPLRKELLSRNASAPSLAVAAAPPLTPAPPVSASRRQQRAAPSTPALSVAALSRTLPAMRANSELSTNRGSLRGGSRRDSAGSRRDSAGSRRDKITSLARSEVSSQCSELLGRTMRLA